MVASDSLLDHYLLAVMNIDATHGVAHFHTLEIIELAVAAVHRGALYAGGIKLQTVYGLVVAAYHQIAFAGRYFIACSGSVEAQYTFVGSMFTL